MRDDELRGLERAVRESPDDPAAWARYVRALEGAGALPRLDDEELTRYLLSECRDGVGISPAIAWAARVLRVRTCLRDSPDQLPWPALIGRGDEVWVEEGDAPKIIGRWRGRVLKIFIPKVRPAVGPSHDFHVRPLALDEDIPEIAWRTSPRPEWLRDGLVVSPPIDRIELIARGPSTPGAPAR